MRDQFGDLALELLALLAAWLGRFIGLEQSGLGEDDVGFLGWSAAEAERALEHAARLVGEASRKSWR